MADEKSMNELVGELGFTTDADGRGPFVDEATDATQLSLVSTQMLKQILSSDDEQGRKSLEEVAGTEVDGVLAMDSATGYFEIIDNDELQAILDGQDDPPKVSKPKDVTLEPLHDYEEKDSLSLVSTQALRHVLGDDIVEADRRKAESEVDPENEVNVRGFNPYDCY